MSLVKWAAGYLAQCLLERVAKHGTLPDIRTASPNPLAGNLPDARDKLSESADPQGELNAAVQRAMTAHRNARVAIRKGNGRVIALLQEALGGEHT